MGGTTLVDQWLRLCASSAEDMGLIPGFRTKIPHAMWHDQTKTTHTQKKQKFVKIQLKVINKK